MGVNKKSGEVYISKFMTVFIAQRQSDLKWFVWTDNPENPTSEFETGPEAAERASGLRFFSEEKYCNVQLVDESEIPDGS